MMRVLLDEGIPRRLAALLNERHVGADALPADWRAVPDATLHDLAEQNGYSVLVTQDRNMPFQRPLSGRKLAVLIVPQLDRRKVLSEFEAILQRLPMLEAGRYAFLGQDGSLPVNPTRPFWR